MDMMPRHVQGTQGHTGTEHASPIRVSACLDPPALSFLDIFG